MDPGADDLVLKLIVLKCGWAGREDWRKALEERARQRGRKTLTEILGEMGKLSAEQVRLVVDPARRKEHLKRLVEEEKRFWERTPERVGRYPLEGVWAKGGRSVVFRSRRDNRPVAVKILSHAYAFDLDEVERFQRQREFGLLLDHRNLIKIHDAGWEGAVPFLVMEWVEGQPLSQHLEERKALQLESLVDLIVQATQGLGHAHGQGVLHKDVKPDNILVDRVGHVIVSDFGVAQRFGDAGDAGNIVGTPAYMSPEQASGATDTLDARSDVFSLGATLYECLTREQPFQGEGRRAVVDAAAAGRFRRPGRLNPDIPPELEAIVLKAMARRPADRYPGMSAMGEDLALWAGGKAVRAKRTWLGRVLGRE